MIKQIVTPESENMVVQIPREYLKRPLEIQISPVNETAAAPKKADTSKQLLAFRETMEQVKISSTDLPPGTDIDALIDEMNNDLP